MASRYSIRINRLLALVSCLFAILVLPGSIIIIRDGVGGGGSAVIVYENDYEGGTGTTCADSASGDTCTMAGGSVIAAYTNPSGSNGARIVNGGESFDSDAISEAGDLTADFSFTLNSLESPTGTSIFGLESSGNSIECGIELTASSGASHSVNAAMSGATDGSGISFTGGDNFAYFGRLTLDVSVPTCTFYMWTSGYGGTAVGAGSSSTSGGTADAVVSIRGYWPSGQDVTFITGETIICQGIPSSPTTDGRCDTL